MIFYVFYNSFDDISKIPYYIEDGDYENIEKYGVSDLRELLFDNREYYSSRRLVSGFKKSILLNNGYDSIEYLNQMEKMGDTDRYDFIALIPNVIEQIRSSNMG